MRITAAEEIGMRCMLQLATRPIDTVSISELAASEGVPVPMAAKVLLALRRAGLVLATRGRRGGYRLAAQPAEISVARVLQALGKPLFDAAYCHEHGRIETNLCTRMGNCSLRPVWAQLERMLDGFFANTTLADLMRGERSTSRHLAQRWAIVAPAAWHSSIENPNQGANRNVANR